MQKNTFTSSFVFLVMYLMYLNKKNVSQQLS